MDTYRDYRPSLRFGSTVALTPDGGQVAYVDDRTGQFNAVVQQVRGGPARQVTSFTDNTVRRVAWHPDGQSLIFLADTKGDESTQLFRVDLHDDRVEPLTDEPSVQYTMALGDPFSPDGTLLAYAGNDRTPRDQDVLVRDLASGATRRIYAGGGRAQAGHWSPDGRVLTVVEWVDEASQHIVRVAPVDGGPAVRLTPPEPAATYWLGPWLPAGNGFLVRSNAGREYTGLAVMHADTGGLTWMDAPQWDITDATLSGDGRVLAWLVNVDGASRLRAQELATGRDLAVPSLPIGEASALTLSHDGRLAVMLLSTPVRPRNLVLVDLRTGTLHWLTDARPEGVDPRRLAAPALIRYPSRDGTQIPAYLYRPPTSAGRTPVVLSIHGGPQSAERPSYVGIYQYLLRHGIAVLAPNVRGSTGYGRSYQTRIHRDWGGVDLEDWADAVHYLRAQSWVDPTRIGLLGGSYGGFGVFSCVSRLPEFDWAAGVSLCGISNLVTLARSSPPTWRSKVATQIGDPETDAEFLLSRSPITFADRIRTPLLVVQGANDPRVHRQESDQIVDHLRARGVEVRYDVYPDEGHGFARTDNQIRAQSDAAEFLVAHLCLPRM